jgi:hypothetical protein
MAGELWRPTLPAWRRAIERAQLEVQVLGDPPADAPSWLTSAGSDAAALSATILVVDEAQLILTSGEGESVAGVWSSHPLIVMLGRRALQTLV